MKYFIGVKLSKSSKARLYSDIQSLGRLYSEDNHLAIIISLYKTKPTSKILKTLFGNALRPACSL